MGDWADDWQPHDFPEEELAEIAERKTQDEQPNLWAVGPTVFREGEYANVCYDHDTLVLHRVGIERIGGMGQPNAGEFLVNTPCGYTGWVRQINKNPDRLMACEACLNGKPSPWVRSRVFPITATGEAVEWAG